MADLTVVYIREGFPPEADDFSDWTILSVHHSLVGAKAALPSADWQEPGEESDCWWNARRPWSLIRRWAVAP